MLHFLSTAERYLIVCSIKSNLFLVTDAGFEKDGTHNHGTALSSVSVFCIIRKRCAETSDSGGALVEMCFCFCLFMRFGECLLSVLSTRLLQDWNLNAGPHCEEHTETHRWDLFIKQTAFTDEELAKCLELLLETCKKPS